MRKSSARLVELLFRKDSTSIEFLMVNGCRTCKHSSVSALQSREGFGGEKAARKSASLPVPTNHQTTNRPIIAAQRSLRSASGEVEQSKPPA